MDLLAEGDMAEDLTAETKEKLRRQFISSDSEGEIITTKSGANTVEWKMEEAEAEPETVQIRRERPTRPVSEDSSADEEDWTRRNRRLRKRRPANRNPRRSRAEDQTTRSTNAWETVKQSLKNIVYVWGIIGRLAMIPASEAKAEDAVVTGYDCLRPISSRVITAETACVMEQPDLGRATRAWVLQSRRETRPRGWKCTAQFQRIVNYCGIASYTQAIPVADEAEDMHLDAGTCWSLVHKGVYRGPDGTKKPLAVPGRTTLSYITAGTANFSSGKMYCQGEDKRVGGRFLKDVLINEKITITISQEEYVELEGKMEAVTDRQKMACPASAGACAGVEGTYVWRADPNQCDVQLVTALDGQFNADQMIYTSSTAMAVFNVTHGLKS